VSQAWRWKQEESSTSANLGVESALRTVLVVTLSYDEAEYLAVGISDGDCCSLWPSSLYRFLAAQMLACPLSWSRGAEKLDRRLEGWLQRYEQYTPADIVEAAGLSAADNAHELAALLWLLLRRREHALEPLLVRVGEEVEVAVCHLAAGFHVAAAVG